MSIIRRPSQENNTSFALLGTDSVLLHADQEREAAAGSVSSAAGASQTQQWSLIVLLLLSLYFDSSVALWQNVYRDSQVRADGPNCAPLHDWIAEHRDGWSVNGAPTVPLKASPGCPAHLPAEDRKQHDLLTETNISMFVASVRRLEEADEATMRHRECSWKATVDKATGKLACTAETFTKGCALSFQATCGMVIYYSYNYYVGGYEQLKLCFYPQRLLKFSLVGMMFGSGAVFSFLAQDALSPGSYALYAQTGVVIVPIVWRIVFNKPLPVLTWVHIGLIAIGILAYRIAELELDHLFDGIGLLWVSLKVLAAGGGSVLAEMLLKQDASLPFEVQVSCILPSKALSCLLTIWLLPGEDGKWPNSLPDRPGGFFHDWSFLTFVIVFHNLGDTIMSAVIAKKFDSVVKAICGVVGIIFPTWVVSYLAGWEDIDVTTSKGQLKLLGGIVVIVSSFAYVLGRSQSTQLQSLQDQVKRFKRPRTAAPSGDLELANKQ